MKPRLIRRLIRVAFAVPVLTAAVGATSSVAHVGPAAALCAQASFSHRVGLVVEHGDGRVLRRCVGFDTTTITAVSVLEGSGLEFGTASYGGGLGVAVCQIDNEPATYPPSCFSASGSYWVLFVSRAGSAWANSDLGASNVTATNGDDIGFRFDPQAGADPPPPSPAGTCPPATPPPAPTAATPPARGTSRPVATSPSRPTATPRPVPGPSTTPASAVLGLVTPDPATPSVGSAARVGDPIGVNVGLLLAAVGAGGLVGLLGVRTLRRGRG